MLTPQEIETVRATWLTVVTDQARAGERFYELLFETAPETRQLFSNSPRVQGRKLMETLAIVVDALDQLDRILPALRHLGRHHAALGVKPGDYDLVGKVLLRMLQDVAGDRIDPAAVAAWRKAYGGIAAVMISPDAGRNAA